jgi:hypothetical protein
MGDFNFKLSEIITEKKLQEYFDKGWEALSDDYKKSGKEIDMEDMKWKKKSPREQVQQFGDLPKRDKGILLKILGALREHMINKIFKRHETNKKVEGKNEYFAAGSTNITSDYDLAVSGPDGNEIMWLMFKTFLKHYKESLPYAFDSNLYSSPLYIHTTIAGEKLEKVRPKKLPDDENNSFGGFPRLDYNGHGNRQFTLVPQTDDEMNEELEWAGLKLLHKVNGQIREYDDEQNYPRLKAILDRSVILKEHLMKLCEDEEKNEQYQVFFTFGEFAFLNPSENDDDKTKKKKAESKLVFKNYWMQYKAQKLCQDYIYNNKPFPEDKKETVGEKLKNNIFYYSNKANYFASEAYYTSSAVNTVVVENQLKTNLDYSNEKYKIKCKIAAAIEQIGDMTHHIEHKSVKKDDPESLQKIIVKFSKYIYRFWYILGSIGGEQYEPYAALANKINDRIIPHRAKYDVDKIKPEEWKLLDVTDYKENSEAAKKKWLLGVRKHMLGKIEELLRASEMLYKRKFAVDVDKRRNNLSKKEKGRRRTSPNISKTIEKLGGKKKRSRKKKRKKKRKKTKRKRN